MARIFTLAALLVNLVTFALGMPRIAAAETPATETPAAETPTAPPVVSADAVHGTVERAIGYLQSESGSWLGTRKCAACHHAGLPLWALAEAEQRGYANDKKFLADTFESLLGSQEKLLASRIFPNPADPPDPRPQGRGLNMGLPFLSVAAWSRPAVSEAQRASLARIAEQIVAKQQPDGSWEFFAGLRRPPVNESQTTDAVWILLALAADPASATPEQQAALAKGLAWLDAAPAELHQDKAFKVLLGVQLKKPREAIDAAVNDLLALQRPDGGWSQTVPEPVSDAYATGQSLYVLALAGLTGERPEIQRAIGFLLSTQRPDGSWPMLSRSTPDGSPGSSKLLTPINTAAASWATLGLARLVPKGK